MAFLLERDALNGKQGKAFITINGEINELFSIKKFSADVEYQKADFKVVGTTAAALRTHFETQCCNRQASTLQRLSAVET